MDLWTEEFTRISAEIAASIWPPVLIWTLLAACVLLVLKYRSLHVQYHYHLRLALLFALPLGLMLSLFLDSAAEWLNTGDEAAGMLKFIVVQSPLEILPAVKPEGTLSSVNLRYGIGFAIFISGVLVLSIHYLYQYLQLTRLTRDLNLQPIETFTEISRNNRTLATRSGRNITLAYIEEEIIPITFGVRKPVVLLPSALTEDHEKLNLALRHELVHIVNRDFLSHLLVTGIRVVFWYHPLVLILYRQLIEYREMRCDSQVLSDASISRKEYALLLLELQPLRHLNQNFSVSMAHKSSNLKRRIHMIQSNPFLSIPFRTRFSLFSSLILAVVLAMSCTDIQSNNALDKKEIGVNPAPPPQQDAYVVVEEMPELIGGLAEVQSRIKYPQEARDRGIEGRVYVQFVVDEQGNVVNERVVRGIGGGCDEAALEAVREAKFRPGKQRGEAVRVQYALPIVFRLGEA